MKPDRPRGPSARVPPLNERFYWVGKSEATSHTFENLQLGNCHGDGCEDPTVEFFEKSPYDLPQKPTSSSER
jgi:hypothetical protein